MSIKNFHPNLYKMIHPQIKIEKAMFVMLFLVPLVLFTILYFTLDTPGEFFPFNDIIFCALFAIGVMQLSIIPIAQKSILSKSRIDSIFKEHLNKDTFDNFFRKSNVKNIEELSEFEMKAFICYQKFFLTSVIRYALIESIAIFGFIYGNISRTYMPMLSFLVLTCVLQYTLKKDFSKIYNNIRSKGFS